MVYYIIIYYEPKSIIPSFFKELPESCKAPPLIKGFSKGTIA